MSSGSNGGAEPAALALQCFNRGDYPACLHHLNGLPHEPRVEHNRALAELFANDTRNADRYRAVLARLLGVTFPRADLSAGALHRPILAYNYVVLLYHARHYRQAGEVLQRLMDERIEDAELKRRIALLYAETSLCRRAPRRALDAAKAARRALDKDNAEERALAARLACRAQLMLGERVEPADAGVAMSGIEGLILTAHALHARGETAAAAEVLAHHWSVPRERYTARAQGEDAWPALNNNMGVLHLALNKPALAAKYLQAAVKEQGGGAEGAERLCAVRDRPLYIYNLGLALLRAGRPAPAFECLVEAARHFPSSPRVWRRLADCCARHASAGPAAPALARFGSGTHTRLALTSAEQRDYSTLGESSAIPSLSLEFAALCLRNALTLLPARAPNDEPLQAPPGPPLDATQRRSLRNAVLILNSYVLLRLQDPLAALNSATELLRSEGASEGHSVLAHLYAAESLVMLDRVSEASEHLNPPVIHELVSALHPAAQDVLGVQVWATAAVCHILRGDLSTARKILSQLDSPRVVPLQIYLEMCTGNIEACHAILRKIRCIDL